MKLPKIPKAIIIKGQKYRIKRNDVVNDDDGVPVKGLMCPDEKLILLEKETLAEEHKERSKRLILHEIAHAILNECYFTFDPTLEEVLVDSLSSEIDKLFVMDFRAHRLTEK